jgi:hypothetical protein
VDVDLWEDSSCWNLIATKVMSKWNDLHVGDLAFLALCLGMVVRRLNRRSANTQVFVPQVNSEL